MSDPTNIQIKVGVTGGTEGANEINKTSKSINTLETELKAAKKAFKEAEIGTDQYIAASKRMETAHAALSAATGKVSKEAVAMKTAWNNVGYQVQDVAVQVGAGTSAFQALGQQLPQLLSGMGPLGITLGTVAAVALPLAGALFEMGDGAEAAGEKADAAADKLKKLYEARLDKAQAAASKDFKAYLESLDEEWEKLNRNNEAMQRTIDLFKAEHRQKVERQDADAALELIKIDADENTSEADKIVARAEINKRIARQKLENERIESNDRIYDSVFKADTAEQAAAAAKSKAGSVGKTVADQVAEAAALRGRVSDADAAIANLPGLIKAEDAARQTGFAAAASGDFSKEDLAKLNEDYKARFRAREAAEKAAGGVDINERTRLATLAGVKNDKGQFEGGEIDKNKATLESLKKAAEDLAVVAASARLDAEKTQTLETGYMASKEYVTGKRVEGQGLSRDIEVRKVVKKTAEDYISDQEKEEKKSLGLEIGGRQDLLDLRARQAGTKLRGGSTRGRGRDTQQQVGEALSDGTSEAELQKLADKVRDARSKNGSAVTDMLLELIEGFNNAAAEIETLKRRMKNQ